MPSLTCTKLTLCTIAAVLIQLIGLLLFVLGFFPVKPALSAVSGPESFRSPVCNSIEDQNVTTLPPDQLKLLYQELSGVPPSFDRLVLMVIDGLPAEFVLGKDGQPPSRAFMEAMPYTQSLLANGMAIGYHAKAAPPTVTMPCLKAMMSGAIGGFLDVAFNFNTQALLDDNLIDQFFRIGWKVVMLGDETWLKLFPGLFTRHDGVSSFYVKDTIQVDQNVSRHLGDELNRTDWNLLILHYLGLDHVGHIGGRNSVLMGPKLKEMDEVVKMIHLSALRSQDKDQGKTLLVDIAPTLALLFGVPIPKNNLGVLIAETFDSLADYQRLRALELNSWQLLRLVQVQLPGLSCGSDDQGSGISKCDGSVEEMFCCLYLNAAALHQSWKSKKVSRSNSRDDYGSTVLAYQHFLGSASEWLSGRATDKPVGLLASGIAAMLLSCLALLGLLLQVYLGEKQRLSRIKNNMHKWRLDETFILAIILILVLSIGSSSMVEEEQYIWHFVTSTFYLVLLRKTIQSLMAGTVQSSPSVIKGQRKRFYIQMCSIIVLLISGRILRGWHQGGVNWTHLPDISKWVRQAGSDHVKLIQLVSGLLVITLGLCTVSLLQSKRKFAMVLGFIFLIPGLLVLQHIMNYQESTLVASGDGATLTAQVIYAILGIFTIGTVIGLPWLMPVKNPKTSSSYRLYLSTNDLTYIQTKFLPVGFIDSTFLIGISSGLRLLHYTIWEWQAILVLLIKYDASWRRLRDKKVHVCWCYNYLHLSGGIYCGINGDLYIFGVCLPEYGAGLHQK
ncbi:hypothetical protein F0562_003163 [Nyssa sinensis]|uniref:GPI ethanolamine phosphate transferase 2 C-terminal domain-containing protein n=1 Tax=Nyssa sinensis TaxID=561372 RepID=A0A5J5BVR8_9ASTE|nr:hypothetical protein F0562_003163 [Nyssa sinensis]